jgi:hypothetical protein
MALITQALETPPPRPRRTAPALSLGGWRLAASGLALAASFMIGWSLHAPLLSNGAGSAAPGQSAVRPPVQVSALEPGVVKTGSPAPAAYAAYVQDAFDSDLCAEPDDALEPGCL